MTPLLDQYTLAARIRPVVIVLIPLVIAVVVLSPEDLKIPTGAGAILLVVTVGGLVGQMAGDFGKGKERSLWLRWGGPPTARRLRHADTTFNRTLKTRCLQKVAELAPEVRLPTLEEERTNPPGADEIYEAATKVLIARTRDKKQFPLLFAENVAYGFRRNLWGMKAVGILISAGASVACLAKVWMEYRAGSIQELTAIGAVSTVGFLGMWMFWVKPETVRRAAESYADRLLESCEIL